MNENDLAKIAICLSTASLGITLLPYINELTGIDVIDEFDDVTFRIRDKISKIHTKSLKRQPKKMNHILKVEQR